MPHLSPLKWFFFSFIFTTILLAHTSFLWWRHYPSFTPFSHFIPCPHTPWHWS